MRKLFGILCMAIGIITALLEIAAAVIFLIFKVRGQINLSTTIISGSDGPTSVFLAGKLGNTHTAAIAGILVCVLSLAAGAVLLSKKK